MFSQLKPLLLIHKDLGRIAACLEFLVRAEARRQGILWSGGVTPGADGGDAPELFHTVPSEIAAMRTEEHERFMQQGVGDE